MNKCTKCGAPSTKNLCILCYCPTMNAPYETAQDYFDACEDFARRQDREGEAVMQWQLAHHLDE